MHYTNKSFWQCYATLPPAIQKIADQNYQLLKVNPAHPSLHFKRVGPYWSVRVSQRYRALEVDVESGILWFWIGGYKEYERLIEQA